MKDCSVRVSKRNNWVLNIKELLYSKGFGYVWEQQTVNNEYQFIREFKRRMQDMYVQQCFGEIHDSSRSMQVVPGNKVYICNGALLTEQLQP